MVSGGIPSTCATGLPPTQPVRATGYNMHMQWRSLPLLFTLVSTTACGLHAQDEHRGRKYNAPPPVAHVVVTVTKGLNNKPVESAAVIFHTLHNGKDQGNLEVKTNEEGRAVIDVIPIGDTVRLQVIKSGFQTYGEDFAIDSPSREIAVKMKAPARQYSIYEKQQGSEGQQPATPQDAPKPPQ